MALCVLVSGLAVLSTSRPGACSRCHAPQLSAEPKRVAEPQISVLDEWEELPDGRFTGRLLVGAGAEAGAEVWITPRAGSHAHDTDVSGAARITSAGGRPYLLGVPRTEAVEAEGAFVGVVEPLQIYKKSAVVGKYIKENAPPAVRDAMRERDAGFLRVAVGVAVLAYAAGLYVGSQPMDGREMAPGEQPVLAPWHGRSSTTVTAGAPSAPPLTLQGARTLQGTVGEQRLRQEVVVDCDPNPSPNLDPNPNPGPNPDSYQVVVDRDRLQLRELEVGV